MLVSEEVEGFVGGVEAAADCLVRRGPAGNDIALELVLVVSVEEEVYGLQAQFAV